MRRQRHGTFRRRTGLVGFGHRAGPSIHVPDMIWDASLAGDDAEVMALRDLAPGVRRATAHFNAATGGIEINSHASLDGAASLQRCSAWLSASLSEARPYEYA